MAWFKCNGGSGMPSGLQASMNAVLNKKFGTSGQTYAPSDWPDDVNLLGKLPEKTISGAIASCSDGADAVPVKSWEIEVEPNLNGKSQIVATQTKKNQIDISGTDVDNGYISGRWISSSNSPNTNADWYTTEYLPILPNTEYTLSGIAYGNSPAFCFYDETKTFISGIAYSNRTTITFTSPNNAKYARFSIKNDFTSFMLEFGSTATSFEPYSAPVDNTVNLGQTIYGGEADVVNGTGKSTHGTITFDGTETWSYGTNASNKARVWIKIDDAKAGSIDFVSNGVLPDPAKNAYPAVGYGWINPNSQIIIGVDETTITSHADWETYLSSNNITVVYELATPEDFTFTPITPTPETALGTNNFWADTGDSEVTYRADIDLALAQLSGTRGLMMASRGSSEPESVEPETENTESGEEEVSER